MDTPLSSLPTMRRLAITLAALASAVASHADAQALAEPRDTVVDQVAPGDVRGAARSAQVRFERGRVPHLPRARTGSNAPCDETVGRFCTWYDEGDWTPEAEAPEIARLRDELLAQLDSLQPRAPGDAWILGQRVWYRAEAEDWAGALEVARACGPPQEPWWCAALTGLALHGLERYPEAERAFDLALWEMDVERAWTWRVPVRAVDGEGREILESLRDAPVDSVERVLDRLWSLADPLELVEGNDRKTAHFARWTVATIRDGARTPYGIRWGSDLEELLVRHGWELGWERELDPWSTGPDRIVGHKHPEGRDYLPPGRALGAPVAADPGWMTADRTWPRSLYAPPYAPVILPMDGQVAIFPRGRSFAVVTTHYLPPDTTRYVREGLVRPWMDPGAQDTIPDVAGLHLAEARTGKRIGQAVSDAIAGGLMLEARAGEYVLSVEAWSPGLRRAGRLRTGVSYHPRPEDIPVLSDLLLIEGGGEPPVDLESAIGTALPTAHVAERERLGIVWEVSGLDFRAESLAFDLSVGRIDRGLLSRLGGFLGLSDGPRPLVLRWQEVGPDEPSVVFRHLDLDLPDVSPGRYEIRLTLRTTGREPVRAVRTFEVRTPTPR